MLRLESFRHIVSDDALAKIYDRARDLYGKHIVHVNATYQGGGVAEILYPLTMLMNDVGIDTGWRILHGSQEFFECYNVASDDPEGLQMYTKVVRKANKLLENGDIVLVVGNTEPLVNAIQRFSNVIIQKSTKEGFCLAVTEALWKRTPVVASRVGGIPVQIDDGKSGYLLDPQDLDGFAEKIVHLLTYPEHAEEIGHQAREKVRQEFLITRLLSDYLFMLTSVLNQSRS